MVNVMQFFFTLAFKFQVVLLFISRKICLEYSLLVNFNT